MRAITICQPHAWAIIHGPKLYENRRWSTRYRGPILIHAGKSQRYLYGRRWYPGQPPDRDLIFGAIVGVVEMVDCIPVAKALRTPCAEGPWCHEYSKARPLSTPLYCAGALGLWLPSQEIIAEALSRVAAESGATT